MICRTFFSFLMEANGLRKRRAVYKVLKGTTKFFINQKAFRLPSSRMDALRFVTYPYFGAHSAVSEDSFKGTVESFIYRIHHWNK